MDVSALTVLSQNITLVYKSLDLKAVDVSKLKGAFGDPTIVMDTPDMIVVVHPPTPLVLQIGDRRVRLTVQRPGLGVGEVPLWELAYTSDSLVSQSQLVAYGFNYDLQVDVVDANLHEYLVGRFVRNQELIEDVIDGDLSSFIPRLKFIRGKTLYDLILEPLDGEHLKAHLNVHINSDCLPHQDQLEVSFKEEFELLVEIVRKLFRGED